MKKLFILFISLVFLNNVKGQELHTQINQTPQEIYDFHIQKRKNNKTAGWITLGSGVAMIIGGVAINISGGVLGDSDETSKGLWLSYLGGAVTLVSIPLFISAGKHKRKAKIQLQNGAVGFNNEFKYSGVSFTFSF